LRTADVDVDLRIAGKKVTRCLVDYSFSLQFWEKSESTIVRIGGRMNIERAGTRLSLSAEKPTEAGQACFLVGGTIKNAVGFKDGSLALSFTDGTTLTVPFDENYEAWEASADDGFMVVSLPGGRLATWSPRQVRIFADFNYSTKLLPLRFKGSNEDLRKQRVDLHQGLHIIVYDDMCQAEAVVEKIDGEWWARVTGKIREIR
jgi:hypothetical protein